MGANPRAGAQPIIWQNICRELHRIERFGTVWGGFPWTRPCLILSSWIKFFCNQKLL